MGIFSRNPDHRAEGDPNKSRGTKGRKTDEEGPASKSVRRDRKVARDEVSKVVTNASVILTNRHRNSR